MTRGAAATSWPPEPLSLLCEFHGPMECGLIASVSACLHDGETRLAELGRFRALLWFDLFFRFPVLFLRDGLASGVVGITYVSVSARLGGGLGYKKGRFAVEIWARKLLLFYFFCSGFTL